MPYGQAGTAEVGGEGLQRTRQTEFVQHTGAQPTGDTTDLVQTGPGGLLHLAQLLQQVGRGLTGHPLEFEQNGREGLTDLVVQLPGDTATLGLLGGQDPGAARGPLVLQPVEHGVEGRDQLGDLRLASDRRTPPRTQQVRRRHGARQALERGEPDPQQQGVGDEHRGQPHRQHRGLREQHRRGDGHGPQQQRGRRDQHEGVQQEDPPEQGHRVPPPPTCQPPSSPSVCAARPRRHP